MLSVLGELDLYKISLGAQIVLDGSYLTRSYISSILVPSPVRLETPFDDNEWYVSSAVLGRNIANVIKNTIERRLHFIMCPHPPVYSYPYQCLFSSPTGFIVSRLWTVNKRSQIVDGISTVHNSIIKTPSLVLFYHWLGPPWFSTCPYVVQGAGTQDILHGSRRRPWEHIKNQEIRLGLNSV